MRRARFEVREGSWVLVSLGFRVLTALSQDKAATLLGVVARVVHHVDGENIIRHESRQGHVARVLHVCGVVA